MAPEDEEVTVPEKEPDEQIPELMDTQEAGTESPKGTAGGKAPKLIKYNYLLFVARSILHDADNFVDRMTARFGSNKTTVFHAAITLLEKDYAAKNISFEHRGIWWILVFAKIRMRNFFIWHMFKPPKSTQIGHF